jgi:hypothetical protein
MLAMTGHTVSTKTHGSYNFAALAKEEETEPSFHGKNVRMVRGMGQKGLEPDTNRSTRFDGSSPTRMFHRAE